MLLALSESTATLVGVVVSSLLGLIGALTVGFITVRSNRQDRRLTELQDGMEHELDVARAERDSYKAAARDAEAAAVDARIATQAAQAETMALRQELRDERARCDELEQLLDAVRARVVYLETRAGISNADGEEPHDPAGR
jgi:hypothetical protein